MEGTATIEGKTEFQDHKAPDSGRWTIPWTLFLSELIGTALLLLLGLSLVIFMFGSNSPMASIIQSHAVRRLVTGFVFGSIGASIALSGVGKESGAHINPIVTLAFRLMGKLDLPTTLTYILGQITGAILGCLPLLFWGAMGKSVSFGATVPGAGYTLFVVFLGEVITTFTMITLLGLFLAFHKFRPYTPAIFPILYSLMSWLEAPISGTSTNPARSFGPSLISGNWDSWWIYWAGPVTGMFLAVLALSLVAKRIEVAKLYHFDTNRDLIFRRKQPKDGEGK